jgi:DNA polymerase-1
MINIHKDLKRSFRKTSMLLQVHDELVFETPADRVEELAAWVKEKMESAFSLGDVKLIAETGHGANWFEAH